MAESLVAAGDDADATDVSLTAPASVVAPSLLLAEAELQRSETKPEKPPILPAPRPPEPEPEHRAAVKNAPGKGAFIQVDRYLLSGREELVDALDVPGATAWRQTRTPDGLVVDVKIVGRTAALTGAAARHAAAAIAGLVDGGVHRTALSALRPLASYRARYEDDWPDEGPR
jgi:hypothetical protein